MSAPDLQPTWNAAEPVLPPHIIHEIEKQRREREERHPVQIPLHDVVQEVPPGWEPDPDGGYRRKDEPSRDNDGYGYDF